jgi:hypothetical protein
MVPSVFFGLLNVALHTRQVTVSETVTTTKRKKAMVYADRYGLTRDDRIALAETLLWRDVTSWTQLSEEQLDRLLDALEGYALVGFLRENANGAAALTARRQR